MGTAKTAIVCLGLGAAFSTPARAEDVAKTRLDLSTTDVPAFTALGVSPSKISMPTNVKDFVASLSSGISSTGQVQSGVAIEVSPTQLLRYQDGKAPDASVEQLAKYIDGLALSVGTNALANAMSPTTQAAFGVRWAIWGYAPQADPELAKCIVGAIPPVIIPPGLDADGEPLAPVNNPDTAELKKKRENCRNGFRAAHLASSALQIAYVHSAQAIGNSKLSSFATLADTIWVSGELGINKAKPPVGVAAGNIQVPAAPGAFSRPVSFVTTRPTWGRVRGASRTCSWQPASLSSLRRGARSWRAGTGN